MPEEKLEVEYLPAGRGLALATVKPETKVKRFISGGYEAEYTFAIVYRLAAANDEERLAAAEALDRMGIWAESRENWQALGREWNIQRVERTGAMLKERHADGTEDHQMTVTLRFEGL